MITDIFCILKTNRVLMSGDKSCKNEWESVSRMLLNTENEFSSHNGYIFITSLTSNLRSTTLNVTFLVKRLFFKANSDIKRFFQDDEYYPIFI